MRFFSRKFPCFDAACVKDGWPSGENMRHFQWFCGKEAAVLTFIARASINKFGKVDDKWYESTLSF
jgi:hypothetical protein